MERAEPAPAASPARRAEAASRWHTASKMSLGASRKALSVSVGAAAHVESQDRPAEGAQALTPTRRASLKRTLSMGPAGGLSRRASIASGSLLRSQKSVAMNLTRESTRCCPAYGMPGEMELAPAHASGRAHVAAGLHGAWVPAGEPEDHGKKADPQVGELRPVWAGKLEGVILPCLTDCGQAWPGWPEWPAPCFSTDWLVAVLQGRICQMSPALHLPARWRQRQLERWRTATLLVLQPAVDLMMLPTWWLPLGTPRGQQSMHAWPTS